MEFPLSASMISRPIAGGLGSPPHCQLLSPPQHVFLARLRITGRLQSKHRTGVSTWRTSNMYMYGRYQVTTYPGFLLPAAVYCMLGSLLRTAV